MPVATPLSFLGIAKESTRGTGVAATNFLPVKTIGTHDKVQEEEVNVLKGSMSKVYGIVPTYVWTEVDVAGPVFTDTYPWFLFGLLGDITTTGTSAPFTHACSLLNSGTGQPTSHTIADYYAASGVGARQYAGIQWYETTLKLTPEKLLEHTTKGMGFVQSTVVTKPTASWTTLTPIPVWQAVITIGGSNIATLTEMDVTLKRAVDKPPGLNNTQQYTQIWLGELEADFKFKCHLIDDTELTRYLTNTQPTFDVTLGSGAGAAQQQLKLHFTTGAYVDAKPDRSKQYVQYDIAGKAVANSTDVGASGAFSPVKATAINAIAAGTYI